MKRLLWIGVISLAAAATPAFSGHRHGGSSVTISGAGEGPVERCEQIRVSFDGMEAARAEEEIAVPRSRDPLRISVADNSGLLVQASDRRDSSIRACKAASSAGFLKGITVSLDGGVFSARGPEEREWVVYLLVSVPRGASLDLEASNGPLSVRGSAGSVAARTRNGPLALTETSGTVRAEARNGPISVKGCSGDLEARAENGPISVSRSGGDLRLETQNGPISVELSGSRWEGAGLVARAVNGPLSLKIPDGYQSGTVVEMSGRSPVSCRARACGEASKDWSEDSRRIAFGGRDAVVRLSTDNGPVSIKDREDGRD